MSVRAVLDEHESLRMREACLLQHMDVVYKIARHYSQMFPSHYDDLVQVGAIGLLNAINRYDPAKKTNFKTYASHLIASEMKHYLRDLTAVVKPPRELQELLPRVRQAESVLGMRLGREPLACELIAYLGISFEKLDEIRRLEKNNYPVSLDQEIHSESGNHTLLLDQLEDPQYKSFQLAQEDRLLIAS